MGKHVADTPVDVHRQSWSEPAKPRHAVVIEPYQCHFCGEWIRLGTDYKGERHWLSDCRPDLVEHEIGDKCTHPSKIHLLIDGGPSCYAYKDRATDEWTLDHIHFYEDGPL